MKISQGDIWWSEALDKRRPVLIVTRDSGLSVLNRILVAPVTRTIRGLSTEIVLGGEQGLQTECCATFDNLTLIRPGSLTTFIGSLGHNGPAQICTALAAHAAC